MSGTLAEPPAPSIEALSLYRENLALKHPLDALQSKDPWRVGCGLILAAHCTDAAVNKATTGFFAHYPSWKTVLGKSKDDLVPFLPGISHSGNKSAYILNWAGYLDSRGGDIESTIEALTQVKGIGRKTGAIILFTVKGVDAAIPLDTHALRILDRLGWFPATKSAEAREAQLLPWVPEGHRFETFLILTQHGRRICGAKAPQCAECKLSGQCAYRTLQSSEKIRSEALE